MSGLLERISLVLFSRDDVDKALAQIEDCYRYFDEIVIFDSSREAEHRRFLSEKRRRGLGKLRIHYVVALGYAEPIMMYALKKCSYGWALLSGTDERLSPKLKSDIHEIISEKGFAAFSLIRNEEVGRSGKSKYANWQTRILRIGRAELRGIIHEEAIVDGRIKKLDPSDYYIDHVDELKGSAAQGYSRMERFMRMSYEAFNYRLVDSLYKVTVPERKDRAGSFGMALRSLLLLYERLGGKDQGSEISGFDYFNFYFLYYLAIEVKAHRPHRLSTAWRNAKETASSIREWQGGPYGKADFQISKELYRIGLIRYLGLDNGRTVDALNRKLAKDKVGIELLMRLLRLRYSKGKRWLEWI